MSVGLYCFTLEICGGFRKFIDTATCHHAARALVLSRIDYCNALFTCLSAKNTSRLQRLQNSGARVEFAVGRRTEAESLLRTLHWLPVPQRVTFKILLYVYKALNEQAPLYITELFSYYTHYGHLLIFHAWLYLNFILSLGRDVLLSLLPKHETVYLNVSEQLNQPMFSRNY